MRGWPAGFESLNRKVTLRENRRNDIPTKTAERGIG